MDFSVPNANMDASRRPNDSAICAAARRERRFRQSVIISRLRRISSKRAY